MAEHGAKTTPFKYENGVLCATFPEMVKNYRNLFFIDTISGSDFEFDGW